MLELLKSSLYVDNQAGTVGELMQLHIYCTDPDPAKRKIIVNTMKVDIVSSQDATAPHTTLLTFCGSPQVASSCLYGCAQANALAARLGPAARMESPARSSTDTPPGSGARPSKGQAQGAPIAPPHA